MIQVKVSVPSGCSRTLSLPELSKVEDLKLLAQKSFARGFLRLVAVNGRILTDPDGSWRILTDPDGSWRILTDPDGSWPTLRIASCRDSRRRTPSCYSATSNRKCGAAFAACCGDSSGIQDQLRSVQQVQATCVQPCWPMVRSLPGGICGGDSSLVQDRLQNVQQVRPPILHLLADGSVVTWGDPDFGGDCSLVQDQLLNVQKVEATDTAFAAT